MSSVTGGDYVFDNRAAEAGQRFGALSALFDPVTFRHFDALGIGAGWRCWEVGAGGPSVANWLAARTAPAGYVLATDVNPTWIHDRLDPAVEVVQHDVTSGKLPGDGFHLVHARLVLSHLPARTAALELMMASLRPGGWLLVEDFDEMMPLNCVDPQGPEHDRANRVQAAIRELLKRRGSDLEYARTLPRAFRDAGLRDVGADGYFAVALPAASELAIANVTQVRDDLVAAGLLTQDDIDGHLRALAARAVELGTLPLLATWGRRS